MLRGVIDDWMFWFESREDLPLVKLKDFLKRSCEVLNWRYDYYESCFYPPCSRSRLYLCCDYGSFSYSHGKYEAWNITQTIKLYETKSLVRMKYFISELIAKDIALEEIVLYEDLLVIQQITKEAQALDLSDHLLEVS